MKRALHHIPRLVGATAVSGGIFSWSSSKTAAKCEAPKQAPKQRESSHIASSEEWQPNRADFDVYLDTVTKPDLIKLFRADQEGLEVWPWIWTQPNDNGPHHVFVGPITNQTLIQIRQLKETVPNINLLVVTNSSSVSKLPQGETSLYELECGLVLDTAVELTDFENKMIMLADERIINYTKLYAS